MHGLSGPLSDLYYEPFLIVTATQGRAKPEIKAARREAEAIRDKGLRGVRFYEVPIKTDREITAADIDKYHLILVGTPQSNLLLGRISISSPFAWMTAQWSWAIGDLPATTWASGSSIPIRSIPAGMSWSARASPTKAWRDWDRLPRRTGVGTRRYPSPTC